MEQQKDKYTIRTCKHHGEAKFVLEGRGYYRCTKCRMDAVSRKRKNLKKDLVEYKGGKCEKCDYNKCLAAMDFHHKDPSKKDFGISANGNTQSWSKLKKEVDKCLLLCANCHREIHEELSGYKEIRKDINQFIYIENRQKIYAPSRIIKQYNKCKTCNIDTYNEHYCSHKCCKTAKRKVRRPTKEVLENDIRTMSWLGMGKKYGVSDNAVRKWARGYGLI